MPFKSEKQRRYLWANEPEVARKWSSKYAGGGSVSPGFYQKLAYGGDTGFYQKLAEGGRVTDQANRARWANTLGILRGDDRWSSLNNPVVKQSFYENLDSHTEDVLTAIKTGIPFGDKFVKDTNVTRWDDKINEQADKRWQNANLAYQILIENGIPVGEARQRVLELFELGDTVSDFVADPLNAAGAGAASRAVSRVAKNAVGLNKGGAVKKVVEKADDFLERWLSRPPDPYVDTGGWNFSGKPKSVFDKENIELAKERERLNSRALTDAEREVLEFEGEMGLLKMQHFGSIADWNDVAAAERVIELMKDPRLGNYPPAARKLRAIEIAIEEGLEFDLKRMQMVLSEMLEQ